MSEVKQGVLSQLQEDVAARLTSSSEFSDVKIFTEKQKDIESEIETALGSVSGGICAIVLTPKSKVAKPNLPGPYFDPIAVVVHIIENVLVNQGETGTKRPASYLGELTAQRLHLWSTSHHRQLICEDLSIVPNPDNLIYQVVFRTSAGLTPENRTTQGA